jgi:hypothetical protein
MFPTGDARKRRNQVGLELAAVQMTPTSRFAAIMEICKLPTLRAAKIGLSSIEIDEDAHGLLVKVKLYAYNMPGLLKAQYLTVKFGVLHNGKV